jgi:PBP1b-binding outer membrane lipoprotein LpoB
MKQIIIMALAGIFILTGCKSKEEKALEAIKDEMFKTLYDFESYQPVETKIIVHSYQFTQIPPFLNTDMYPTQFLMKLKQH